MTDDSVSGLCAARAWSPKTSKGCKHKGQETRKFWGRMTVSTPSSLEGTAVTKEPAGVNNVDDPEGRRRWPQGITGSFDRSQKKQPSREKEETRKREPLLVGCATRLIPARCESCWRVNHRLT